MLAALIEEFTAALCWASAARSHIAADRGRPRAGFRGAARWPCPCH